MASKALLDKVYTSNQLKSNSAAMQTDKYTEGTRPLKCRFSKMENNEATTDHFKPFPIYYVKFISLKKFFKNQFERKRCDDLVE